MATVEFGIMPWFYLESLARDFRQVVSLEEMGYDAIWTGDHLFVPRYGPTFDAFTVLAALAVTTRRARIGSAVALVPLRPPALVAKEATTVDLLSGGRLLLGVGVGGEFPWEFAACGVETRERGRRMDEALPLLRRLWRGEEVSYAGSYFRLERFRLEPLPCQPGGPPLWVGGRSRRALRRAALLGDGYMPYLVSPEGYRQELALLRRWASEAGRDPSAVTPAIFLFVALADSLEEGRAHAARFLDERYGPRDFGPIVQHCVPAGTLQDCRAMLEQFVEAGARHLVLTPIAPQAEFLQHAAALAELAARLR